eukprot:g31167.t1
MQAATISTQAWITFFVLLILGGLLMAASFASLPMLLLAPQKFAFVFTTGSACILGALCSLKGMQAFLAHLTTPERRPLSIGFLGSMAGTLWASMWYRSALLTIVFSVAQISSLLWFFISYIPGGAYVMGLVCDFLKACIAFPQFDQHKLDLFFIFGCFPAVCEMAPKKVRSAAVACASLGGLSFVAMQKPLNGVKGAELLRPEGMAKASASVETGDAFTVGAAAVTAAGAVAASTRRKYRPSKVAARAEVAPGEKVVGIDLGTTNSAVAAMEAGTPTVIPNAEGARTTPSVVAYSKSSELLAVVNPENTFYSVKRFVGRQPDEVKEELKEVSYKVDFEGQKVKIDCPVMNKKFAPEEVSAQVLRKLSADAGKYLSANVQKAVVTVPAYFNDSQRQAGGTSSNGRPTRNGGAKLPQVEHRDYPFSTNRIK